MTVAVAVLSAARAAGVMNMEAARREPTVTVFTEVRMVLLSLVRVCQEARAEEPAGPDSVPLGRGLLSGSGLEAWLGALVQVMPSPSAGQFCRADNHADQTSLLNEQECS
ncbi:hypothetical protein GCM10009672_16220 [Nesterenkonia lutea]